LDMTYALQNGTLNACGYLFGPWALYSVFLFRDKFTKRRIEDKWTLNPQNKFLQGLLRLILLLLSVALFALPAIFIKASHVGPIVVMFTNIIIPFILASYVIVGGPYDYLVTRTE